MASSERAFQSALIKKLKSRLPGCIIMKNDANYIQGIPDLLVLYNDRWGALECKNRESSKKQPNQQYYVNLMNDMSFAAFIFPENEIEVLDALQRTLESTR